MRLLHAIAASLLASAILMGCSNSRMGSASLQKSVPITKPQEPPDAEPIPQVANAEHTATTRSAAIVPLAPLRGDSDSGAVVVKTSADLQTDERQEAKAGSSQQPGAIHGDNPVALTDFAGPDETQAQAATAPAPADSGKSTVATRRPPASTQPKVVAQSVLQVNETFIVTEDVLVTARKKFVELPKDISESSFRRQARPIIQDEIIRQVQEALVFQEAKNRLSDDEKDGIEKEIQAARQEMLIQAGGSKANLEQKMIEEGTTLDKALAEYRRHITAQLYVRNKFTPSIFVNRRMLWEYYEQHPGEFTSPKKVQMAMISVSYKDFLPRGADEPSDLEVQAARAKAKAKIAAAAAAIKSGTEFREAAAKYSTDSKKDDGGLWPLMSEGSFRQEEVEKAAFALDEGAVSGVIQADDGYYLVKAVKIEPGKTQSFEEAQGKIEDTLKREQYRKLADAYYEKLRKGAIVVQSDDFFDRCLDRAVERYWGKK